MMRNFRHFMPTDILFGPGVVKELHNQTLPGKKAMIVTSNGKSTKANGSLAIVENELRQAGVETVLFDRVEANPLKSTVMDGAAFARDHQCDFVVALGGGSVMDAAKVMAFMATNAGDVWDYIAGGTGKAQPRQCAPLPLICITTTAGTGSEADAHLSIRIKAVADDNCTLDEIVDNDAFWSDEYIEFKLPACGMNFGGEPLLIGYNGDYWTSTSGGFNQENPEISEYAMCMTFTDTAGYISDSSKTNTGNLRLVEAE